MAMTSQMRLLYRSSNGDRWFLFRQTETGKLFVRHEPAPSSGGLASETEVGAFLAREEHGPEYQALHRIMREMPDRPNPGFETMLR
jgi:hypothetical protein